MSTPPERRPRVLVVDDTALVRAVLRAQLSAHGYDVLEACDGTEGLASARANAPAVALLDIEMPGLSGHAVLEAMQADEALAAIPVVFLTSRNSSEDVADGLRRGAHDYLRKPFEPAELLARVSAAVRTRTLQDDLRERNLQLEQMSFTDVLTRVFNRRYLDDQLRVLVSSCKRHGRSLSVVLADIDHFKAVNDSFGHDAGDTVLLSVAEQMGARLRAEDVLGRWGGEEFLILLPDTDVEGAHALIEDMRRRVQACVIDTTSGHISVTVSFGAAAWAGDAPERLVARADEALYAVKRGGRNRTRWAT